MLNKAKWIVALLLIPALVLAIIALTSVSRMQALMPWSSEQPGPMTESAGLYPRSYQRIISSAVEEGNLTIYSTTDHRSVVGLLAEFKRRYPHIEVTYHDLNAARLNNRFIAEVAEGKPTADLLWSSAMDLQIKLVNDGYAQAYPSPEKSHLPPWAIWKEEAWGVTAEPIVMIYNKELVPADDVPQTHDDLTRLLTLKKDFYAGKIATYDPLLSSVGFLYLTQDVQNNRNTWQLVKALGSANPTLYTSSVSMTEDVAAGRQLIAYNTIGSYVLARLAENPSLGIIKPKDYTLIMSRIAIIPKAAPHPNAAKLFLDFMLSNHGQTVLTHSFLDSVRSDVSSPSGAIHLSPKARAIRVGPGLIANLDQVRRRSILKSWNDALEQNGQSQP